MYKDIYYKESAHVITEAGKSNLQVDLQAGDVQEADVPA